MAEVAGLVLGAVGVAGVIGAFKDAVDLFNLFADCGNLGREFEILDAKLDIEKTLLLQWAEGVGLIRAGMASTDDDGQTEEPGNYDTRLTDPTTQMMMIKALHCLEQLLSDGPELQKRYGVTEAPEPADGSQAPATTGVMLSGPRWRQFRNQYSRWQEVSRVRRDAPTPALKRVRWVVRDREKFEQLVQDVSYFGSKVREILPVRPVKASIRGDVEIMKDFRQLKILLEAASAGFSNAIAESAQRVILERCKDRVLDRLWFRKIDDRRESITTAHRQTLEWSLKPEGKGEGTQWDNLSDWLRESPGIYWVVGKAGSGKSTLMKYLSAENRTKMLLDKWAMGEQLQLCDYFFYNLGTTEQKSQEGLARTLLYQILSRHRAMIPTVLPGMWKEVHDNETANIQDIDLPSVAETRQAFGTLSGNAENLGWFCFLIDGLDEFVGDYRDGITLIRELASNKRFKVIVSSRPIPACVDAFSGVPSLNLQYLNRTDIGVYVRDVLGGHQYMKRLVARHPEESGELFQEVIDKSSGVFLWVVLACRSLITGFADHDRITELRRRVDELPPELEDMFRLMLGKIERRHREQGARLLKTCYTFHAATRGDETKNLYTLGLALVENYSTEFRLPGTIISEEEKWELCLELQGRLRSRCGGLLEIDAPLVDCFCGFERWKHHPLIDSRVVFMHRTVYEFLREETVWDLGVLSLSQDDQYDEATALSLYSLHVAKQIRANTSSPTGVDAARVNLLKNGLMWAALADAQPRGNSALFLNNIQSVLGPMKAGWRQTFGCLRIIEDLLIAANRLVSPGDQGYPGFILALRIGAVNYVKAHLRTHFKPDKHSWRRSEYRPLLAFTLKRVLSPIWPQPIHKTNLRMEVSPVTNISLIDVNEFARTRELLGLLLKSGCDPNEPMSGTGDIEKGVLLEDFHHVTPWTAFLGWSRITLSSDTEDAAAAVKPIISQIIDDFLKYGADLRHLKFDLATWTASAFADGNKSRAISEAQSDNGPSVALIQESGWVVVHPPQEITTAGAADINADTTACADWSLINTPSPTDSQLQAQQSLSQTGPERGGELSLPAGNAIFQGVSNIKDATFSKTRQLRNWVKKHGANRQWTE